MANTNPSTYMNLPIPAVGIDPGPDWATDLNTCLTLVDQHDHSVGSGVQITPAGLNINTDLPLGSNNLVAVRSVRYAAQGSPLALVSDLNCNYVSGVDLYYNDGNGNQIRLTQSGSIVGTSGSITGLVSPASATYVSANQTFVWQSDVNTPANLDAASILLRNLVANSKALTLAPPTAMGSNFTLTLPAIPASQSFMAIDVSGNITGFAPVVAGLTGSMIAPQTITGGNMVDETVSTAQLADDAVTTAKIVNANVTLAKLATDATVGLAKAWVNFNGVQITGSTYSQSGTTVTVTKNSHGLSVGWRINADITSGTGVDGTYTIVTAAANTFTYTAGTSLTTSGNVTINTVIRSSFNVASVARNSAANYTITFTNAMSNADYVINGSAGVGGIIAPINQDATGTDIPQLTTAFSIATESTSGGSSSKYIMLTVFGN